VADIVADGDVTVAEMERAALAARACIEDAGVEEFSEPVTAVYGALHPVTAEELTRIQGRFVACVRAGGIDVVDYPDASRAADDALRRRCWNDAAR